MIPGSLAISVAALTAVLSLIGLVYHAVRRGWIVLPTAPGHATGRIAVVQTLALDPRRRLHLVRCDDQHVAILTGGPRDLLLGWLPGSRA